MIQRSSRKSTYRLLLVATLLLGILTLSGCVAAAPVTTSDPVGVGLTAVARPLENVGITVTIKNNMTKFVSDVKVMVVAVDGNPGIAPFALWQTPEPSVALTAPLMPGKSAQVKLILQQKTPAAIKSYPVNVVVSYKDGDGVAVTKTITNAGIVRVGSINFLSAGIRWIIEQLNNIVHSYALAIILLTFLLKLVTEPLTRMQFKSTVDMQKLQPQIAKLKAKYPNKDDAQKLNADTMKLYKDNNVSIFSGCLPLLVQWPIFLALFTAINNYSPFNNAPFLWAPALSMASSALPLATRFIMPVIVAASTYVQSITSFIPGQDKSQTAMLTYMMPLLLGYWAYGFSIALALYWALFSLFSAAQQYVVIKRLTKGMAVPEPVVVKQAKKK
ncbi:MAG TPA: YidC/Oxa1 family membrane protein insertase [Clostridia bacterium]|nr:YidC/Oxa1 family membrane protein insertase [Clostridia bacterium]